MEEIEENAIKTYVNNSIDFFPNQSEMFKILNNNPLTFQLNGALRARLELSKEMNQFCSLLDNLFQNNSVSDDIEKITVFRAFNYKEMLRYIEDNKYTDFGYMSTSKTENGIRNFFLSEPEIGYYPALLKINIPKNKILDLSDSDSSEKEILIRRSTVFQIISNDDVNSNEYETLLGKDFCDKFNTINVLNLKFDRYLHI